MLGTVGLVLIGIADDNPLYPKWLLLLTPSLWLLALRETGALSYLPAPFGMILAVSTPPLYRC